MRAWRGRSATTALLWVLALPAACGGEAKPLPSVAPAPIAGNAPAPRPASMTSAAARDAGSEAPVPDDIGAAALIRVLDAVDLDGPRKDVKRETKQIMADLAALADPRAADGLVAYIARNPPAHWKTEAALHLAELGDLRAAPTLAWRLGQDTRKLYDAAEDPEWRQDDNERVRAARMLADLANMYPSAGEELRASAEAPALAWLLDRPQPHANGLRFLAAAQSTTVMPKLRAWAEPKEPLPAKGAAAFPMEFATAQVALRTLGRTKDKDAFAVLARQLHRRPAQLDVTMDAAMDQGVALLAMSLRALGTGAAQGFAELGDARATPLLVKYIEDPKENENARHEACFALPWVATDADLAAVAKKVLPLAQGGDTQRLVAICYLEALGRASSPDAARVIATGLMKRPTEATVRTAAARAIGLMGVPADVAPALIAMLTDPALHDDAALALLLGGTPEQARGALDSYADDPSNLKAEYARSFEFFSDRAYDRGQMARWAKNADACRDAAWPVAVLSHALRGVDYDNGPHSLTRAVLRHRLTEDAKSGAPAKKQEAALLLRLAGEKGVLASLGLPRDAPGP